MIANHKIQFKYTARLVYDDEPLKGMNGLVHTDYSGVPSSGTVRKSNRSVCR